MASVQPRSYYHSKGNVSKLQHAVEGKGLDTKDLRKDTKNWAGKSLSAELWADMGLLKTMYGESTQKQVSPKTVEKEEDIVLYLYSLHEGNKEKEMYKLNLQVGTHVEDESPFHMMDMVMYHVPKHHGRQRYFERDVASECKETHPMLDTLLMKFFYHMSQ